MTCWGTPASVSGKRTTPCLWRSNCQGRGGWHLLGDVVFTPDTILREQVKLVSSLESVCKNRGKIFIPPISRFVFGSCCTNTTQGSNTRSDTHRAQAINEHIRQRHTIIKSLNSTGITNHKVIDIMHCLREGPDTKENRLTCLNPLVPDRTLKYGFSKKSCRYLLGHNTTISYSIFEI